jgi:hypothetical protein
MAESTPRGTSPVKWTPVTPLPLAASDLPAAPVYARFMPKLVDFPLDHMRQLTTLVHMVAIYSWLCHVLLRIKPTPDTGPRCGGGVQHWVR